MHLSVSIIQKESSFLEVYQWEILTYQFRNDGTDVINLSECFKQRDHFKETLIVWVIVPRQDWHCILWMEVVSIGRVVNNHDIFHRTAQQG